MKVTVRADGFEGWVKRGREQVRRIARKETIEPEITINFESPLEMLECLSPERMRLFEATKARACSMSELAVAEARSEVGAARCEEAGAVRRGADAGGDQSGTWAGEDCGACRGEV